MPEKNMPSENKKEYISVTSVLNLIKVMDFVMKDHKNIKLEYGEI
jgi:hypothetical protein